MSKSSQIILWLIIAAMFVAVLRRPAAFVGSTLAIGSVGNDTLGTLEGGKGSVATSTGTFKTGKTRIKLGA